MQLNPFEVLADPTRRAIVNALRGRERSVNAVVETVSIHQSGVSRHLRILSESGFVQVRAHGAQRLYSLRPEPFRELDVWLAGYRALWDARLDRFATALAKKQHSRPRRPTRPLKRNTPEQKR
jgi:DNA-binding transcriptional ArsR family regulator